MYIATPNTYGYFFYPGNYHWTDFYSSSSNVCIQAPDFLPKSMVFRLSYFWYYFRRKLESQRIPVHFLYVFYIV